MKIKLLGMVVLSLLFFVSCAKKNGAESTNGNGTSGSNDELKGQSAVEDVVSDPNVLQAARTVDEFSTFVAAAEAGGVEDALVNAGPLTVFAPTNKAFESLPEGTLDDLLKPENKKQLAFILTNHVAPANYPVKQLEKEAAKNRMLFMASGKYLKVESKDDGVYVDGVRISKTLRVSNGWIHVIDQVLVPVEEE